MLKHRLRRLAVVLGVLSLTAAGVVVVAASSNAASKTKKLHGHMVNISNFFAPTCTSASGICSRFDAKGDIKGEGVVFVDTAPNPDTPSYSKAHTVIHTKKGDLTCTEAALFDVAGEDHAFVDLCLITGGTGVYDGATGYIQEVGTFDFANNLGELEYYGKITFADD
jgi:hypothetical protein